MKKDSLSVLVSAAEIVRAIALCVTNLCGLGTAARNGNEFVRGHAMKLPSTNA